MEPIKMLIMLFPFLANFIADGEGYVNVSGANTYKGLLTDKVKKLMSVFNKAEAFPLNREDKVAGISDTLTTAEKLPSNLKEVVRDLASSTGNIAQYAAMIKLRNYLLETLQNKQVTEFLLEGEAFIPVPVFTNRSNTVYTQMREKIGKLDTIESLLDTAILYKYSVDWDVWFKATQLEGYVAKIGTMLTSIEKILDAKPNVVVSIGAVAITTTPYSLEERQALEAQVAELKAEWVEKQNELGKIKGVLKTQLSVFAEERLAEYSDALAKFNAEFAHANQHNLTLEQELLKRKTKCIHAVEQIRFKRA